MVPPLPTLKPSAHRWRFFRVGGFDQVNLASGQDLLALDQLDQKLWVALSCPTKNLEFDPKTLALLDTDQDGHVRAPELIAAARWTGSLLKNPDDLLKESDLLPLAAIRDDTPEGQQILACAREILKNLGKPDATSISLADTGDTDRIFSQTTFNGDGIVIPEAADSEPLRSVIDDIIKTLGPETDRSGKPGINQAKLDQFFTETTAFLQWHQQSLSDARILPLAEKTPAAAALLRSLRLKIDDYFTRARLAAFDPRALGAVNREEKEYVALAEHDLSLTDAAIARLPIARVEAGKPLSLAAAVNPAWAGVLKDFQATVVQPLLGDLQTLAESQWTSLLATFAPYEAWCAAKPATAVETLGPQRLRQILEAHAREAIHALIQRDKALESEANSIAAVDKLVRFHRDLYPFMNNYVAFRDFYGRRRPAVFQAGTLFLDQRSCNLCLRVEDSAKHSALAALSRIYLAYCDLTRPASGEKMTIAAAFTDGDSDNLMIGRNGIFYDRQGRDWNATITKIIDHPISIRQAFWSPYKKFVRLIETQAEKIASAREQAVQDKAAAKVAAASAPPAAPTPAPAPGTPIKKEAFDIARFAGIFAAIGLALGMIGGAIGAMLGAFTKLAWWQMPLALLGILLIISGPSMLLAWLKLRQRNLGPLLDANGWAINSRAKINLPFGASLTGVPRLPAGSDRDLTDPFAPKRTGRKWFLAFLVLAAALLSLWYFGVLHQFFPALPNSPFIEQREQTPTTDPAAPIADAPAPTDASTPTEP